VHLEVRGEVCEAVFYVGNLKVDFFEFFLFIYVVQYCIICRHSDSIASEDAEIESMQDCSDLGIDSHADALPTRLDLIHTRLDLTHTFINSRLDLTHTLINSRLDLTHTRLDLIHCRNSCVFDSPFNFKYFFVQEVAIGQYLGAGGMTLVSQLCPMMKGKYSCKT
jgi:hypothetical protein